MAAKEEHEETQQSYETWGAAYQRHLKLCRDIRNDRLVAACSNRIRDLERLRDQRSWSLAVWEERCEYGRKIDKYLTDTLSLIHI